MKKMLSMVVLSIPLLVLTIGLMIFIQIRLSKNSNKFIGFILPIITFIFSIIVTLNMGNTSIGQVLIVFFICNISTIILLGINYFEKKNLKSKREIEKMKIEDL